MIKTLLRSGESGQAIAEFAVILPVFLFVGFMIIDMQWMVKDAANIDYVVAETARCEALVSFACTAPNTPQGYATGMARNFRLELSRLAIQTPPCSAASCVVTATYQYKPLGLWFPSITISRTGVAAVAPPPVAP